MNKISGVFFFLFAFCLCAKAEPVEDFAALELKNAELPKTNTNYDYTDTFSIPLYLQITEKISTKDKDLYEGKKVYFKAVKTSFYKHKPLLKEGEIVEAEVKYIISSGLNGIPYTIIIDDFKFKNLDSNKILSGFQKDGFNRTYFVLPLKWALTPLPPTGSLTNFIKGGHSKITPKDKITLYYFPNWK